MVQQDLFGDLCESRRWTWASRRPRPTWAGSSPSSAPAIGPSSSSSPTSPAWSPRP